MSKIDIDPPRLNSQPTDKSSEPVQQHSSAFTQRQKWLIVSIVGVAGLFSPLSANIYLPAIPAIASAFHKSTELINVTVTVYMLLQGFSPMVWGTLSDKWGRRPIFIACLLILTLSCVGLASIPTSAYWALVLLRCVQAAGSASTVALGAGVVSDISTPEKRGSFFGLYSLGPMVGPTLGPVIGGVLEDKLGWRSIFWFLCIASGVCLIFIILLLPETLCALVGDGSITPSVFYRPVIPMIGPNKRRTSSTERPPKRPFANPLRLFTHYDILLLLVVNGIFYAVFYSVTAMLSTLFHQAYPFLSETDVGLCFMASGGGMIFGSLITGMCLDRDYQIIKSRMIREAEADTENKMSPEDVTKEPNFPIEKARLRTMPIYYFLFIASCAGYGWCLQHKVNIAGPLLLQLIIGYSAIAIISTTQTMLIDLAPSQGSSITACNNLVRCSLGAVAVSVVNLIDVALGTGWTYVLLAGICLLFAPSVYLEMRIGPACRARRRVSVADTN